VDSDVELVDYPVHPGEILREDILTDLGVGHEHGTFVEANVWANQCLDRRSR
jgi:hypothetical protein